MSKRKLKRPKKKDIKQRSQASKRSSEINNALSNLDIFLQTGQLLEAEKVLAEIIALKPNSLETLNVLSNAAVRLNKFDTSIELLQKGCRIDRQDINTRYDLGIRLLQAERLEEAVEALKKAASLAPGDAEIYYDLGNSYYELKEFKRLQKPLIRQSP